MPAYAELADLEPLLTTEDYCGVSIFEILTESYMYKVLDSKSLDRLVKEKWYGIDVETHSIIASSTAY